MAEITALRCLRYADQHDPEAVLAPPYDVIGPEDRARLAARSPHNVVHLDLPEGEGDDRYETAAKLLRRWLAEGVLVEDERPFLMRYRQTFPPPEGVPGVDAASITRSGFFALVHAEPYRTRAVLPHERTLSGPKEDRFKLMRATEAALSPLFLLYTDAGGTVRRALDGAAGVGARRFRTEDDGIVHELDRVEDPATLAAVAEALRPTSLLIADGHHRYETAVRYGEVIDEERAAAGRPAAGPRAAHRFALAFLADADDPGLVVFPTHRLVHGLSGFDRGAFLRAAETAFEVRRGRLGEGALGLEATVRSLQVAGSDRRPAFTAVFPDGETAELRLREEPGKEARAALDAQPAVLRGVDVVVLHTVLLEGVLGITREAQAAQTNLRYLKAATKGVDAIRRGEGDVLFLTNATPVDEVREACLAGEVMPQKSTFFFPKVPTGLLIHRLDPARDL